MFDHDANFAGLLEDYEAGNRDPEVVLDLADCYLEGWGTDPDPDKGLCLLEQAAAMGHEEAQYGLGCYLLDSHGAQAPAPKEAFLWIERSTRPDTAKDPYAKPDPEKLFHLALMFETGTGTGVSRTTAIDLYTQARALVEEKMPRIMRLVQRHKKAGTHNPHHPHRLIVLQQQIAKKLNELGVTSTPDGATPGEPQNPSP